MSDRLSAHGPLDTVLGGGLPVNGISMITGLPGTGKTIIAQQYVFQNATPERPAVYFSTVSEPTEKIVRFGQRLDFFDRAAIGRSVFYEDLGETVSSDGLAGVTRKVAAVLSERHPGLVVIDSFKALHAFADSVGEFRRFLHELTGRLTAFPASSLWIGEYQEGEAGSLPEFAVADAIVGLTAEMTGQREVRFLTIRKLRGSGYLSGRHAYRLDSHGVHLFPRLADTGITASYALGSTRVPSGIPALDDLLSPGYLPASSTLIAGPAGVGKTVMGLHFIFYGARRGEPGVIASLQENSTQLQRVADGFGWSVDEPEVEMMYRSPVDIYIDEWVYDLMEMVERTGARRVLVDSLADLKVAAPDETRFREFVYSVTQRFSKLGVSTLMTFEIPELFRTERLAESAVSHMSDNVVLLSYVEDHHAIGRSMSVIKSRGSDHLPGIRQFVIGRGGIVLADGADTPA